MTFVSEAKEKCQCDCDTPIVKKYGWYTPRFINGHAMKGKHHSDKAKQLISEANSLSNNGQWKGDNVSYGSLHDFIKYHLPKPELCEICNKSKSYDVHNISGKYKRDLTDWQWICRRCHMLLDRRMKNLVQFKNVN